MTGRLEIDVYTYMRKEFTLESYKLDYVSSYLLGDKIIEICSSLFFQWSIHFYCCDPDLNFFTHQ